MNVLLWLASGDQLRELTPLVEAGTIRPAVDTVFPFESAREALEYLEAGHAKAGEVVVRMT
ncbi:zinc-binding dehydrogenase [Streptomyces ipomoeae]|uniref:zinc-binding dehydrogenase n=1 Tax=Streptomyces ipomoeae TaxID=103232 RepID=UPI001FD08B08|nr:zinc-binding dehydrogenase [Streptomyces ipomoeae]MDX2939283.1 zinc-binding dehydrogenase [Streptomyces ipomoeae]